MIKFSYEKGPIKLSLEVKPHQIILSIAMFIALLNTVSPAQSDTGFKHSVDILTYLTTIVVKP